MAIGSDSCARAFSADRDEIAAAWPGVALVDGAEGIARRVAHLTAGQPWPQAPTPGIALFTAPPPASLGTALARFGLDRIIVF